MASESAMNWGQCSRKNWIIYLVGPVKILWWRKQALVLSHRILWLLKIINLSSLPIPTCSICLYIPNWSIFWLAIIIQKTGIHFSIIFILRLRYWIYLFFCTECKRDNSSRSFKYTVWWRWDKLWNTAK